MLYDRIELLELFDDENFIDIDAAIAFYTLKGKDLSLSLYLSPCEDVVSLIIDRHKSKVCLCKIKLNNIQKLRIDRDSSDKVRLLFYKEEKEEPLAILMIKPEISLHCNF